MSLSNWLPPSLTVTFSYSTAGRLGLTEFTKIYKGITKEITFRITLKLTSVEKHFRYIPGLKCVEICHFTKYPPHTVHEKSQTMLNSVSTICIFIAITISTRVTFINDWASQAISITSRNRVHHMPAAAVVFNKFRLMLKVGKESKVDYI